MSEDRSGGTSKSWLEKLTQAFSDEPRSLEDVREILLGFEGEEIH